MLDLLFNETFTVRRASTRTATNDTTYAEPTDEPGGAAVPILCRIERKGRRTYDRDGVQLASDATLIYRKQDVPALQVQNLVVSGGETYRILALEEQPMLFAGVTYVRADLARTRTPVPGDTTRD